MKKIILLIVVLAVAFGAIYFIQKSRKVPVDPNVTTYRNSNLGISFTYPKILTLSKDTEKVTLHHEVPFTHPDYCDFKGGEGNSEMNTLTDFHVDFYIQNKGLVDTMKTISPYIPKENFVNNNVVPSPGFIDSYQVGDWKGYKIFEGAEGCGQITYYFPISNTKTFVIKEELITIFTGIIIQENEDKARAVPGVIDEKKSTQIFESILETLKVS